MQWNIKAFCCCNKHENKSTVANSDFSYLCESQYFESRFSRQPHCLNDGRNVKLSSIFPNWYVYQNYSYLYELKILITKFFLVSIYQCSYYFLLRMHQIGHKEMYSFHDSFHSLFIFSKIWICRRYDRKIVCVYKGK